MATKTPTAKIRKKILKQRGVAPAGRGKLVTYDELPADYHKTPLMRLVEYKQGAKLEDLIFAGTIYTVAKQLGIDPTTVYKWRKIILAGKEEEFFNQF
jgi:hypothetical protein